MYDIIESSLPEYIKSLPNNKLSTKGLNHYIVNEFINNIQQKGGMFSLKRKEPQDKEDIEEWRDLEKTNENEKKLFIMVMLKIILI